MRDAVDQVVELLGYRADRPGSQSWEPVEALIGEVLPVDYKALVDRTGPIVVDDLLCIYGPGVDNRLYDLEVLVRERDDAWPQFREVGVELPDRYFSAGNRLIAFANVDAHYLYWHARSGVHADDWGVVVNDADVARWRDFDLSATESICQLLRGDLAPDIFEDLFQDGQQHHVSRWSAGPV